jgi:hypothetical protein
MEWVTAADPASIAAETATQTSSTAPAITSTPPTPRDRNAVVSRRASRPAVCASARGVPRSEGVSKDGKVDSPGPLW